MKQLLVDVLHAEDVREAESMDRALEILTAEGAGDLVLVDWRMPGMSGAEIAGGAPRRLSKSEDRGHFGLGRALRYSRGAKRGRARLHSKVAVIDPDRDGATGHSRRPHLCAAGNGQARRRARRRLRRRVQARSR
ncbi:MAG: hypothetical protein IPL62_04840 [Caulobacteraceae bacterium]|nr:hypothetical protein [Caulobacteraceae bacterium]